MTKEYFPHDYGTRHKKKMAALRSEKKMRGYGLFWVIVEMLHEDSTRWMELDEITYIAIAGQSDEPVKYIKDFVDACINRYKVFLQEGNKFTTERVLRNIDKRMEISASRSESGKRGAMAKWQTDGNCHTSTKQLPGKRMAKNGKVKESKRKESKIYKSDWDQFPTAQSSIQIDEGEIQQAVEFVARIKQITLSAARVLEFWEAFRVNLSGDFYASRSKLIQHFRNWLKDRDLSETEIKSKPQQAHVPENENTW